MDKKLLKRLESIKAAHKSEKQNSARMEDYLEVISELVGIELDKQAQSSDWGRVEELSTKQLAYAANDVRYLLEAKRRLEDMLKREGRWELAQRCFSCIPVIAELDRLRFTQIFEH